MAELHINDSELASLKGQVIVITGASSGIGLATTDLLLSLGASVVAGDLNPSPTPHDNLTFVQTDVTSWPSIMNLFTTTQTLHGRVDHVFANAGIAIMGGYLETAASIDPTTGGPPEPSHRCLDVNLTGCLNTAYAGLHWLQRRRPGGDARGGSIVCTASAVSYQGVGAVDYAVSKHGVLGFVRSVTLEARAAGAPVRINAVAPSWTLSNMVAPEVAAGAGLASQGPEVVARNVALFMADESRKGQVVYSRGGRYVEVEEAVVAPVVKAFVGEDNEDEGYQRIMAWAAEQRKERAEGPAREETQS